MRTPILASMTRVGTLALAVFTVGCASDPVSLPAGSSPTVSNSTAQFGWDVSGLDNITQDFEYTWANSSATANVTQASSLGDGAAGILIYDAAGKLVYSTSMEINGAFRTDTGAPGNWTVKVRLDRAFGTLEFSAEPS